MTYDHYEYRDRYETFFFQTLPFFLSFRISQFHFNQYRNEGGGEKGESDG